MFSSTFSHLFYLFEPALSWSSLSPFTCYFCLYYSLGYSIWTHLYYLTKPFNCLFSILFCDCFLVYLLSLHFCFYPILFFLQFLLWVLFLWQLLYFPVSAGVPIIHKHRLLWGRWIVHSLFCFFIYFYFNIVYITNVRSFLSSISQMQIYFTILWYDAANIFYY